MYTTSVSLLERLRQPAEQEAWTRFVQLYTPLVYGWARRVGLSPEDSSDLVQDVFAALVRKLPEFVYDRTKSFRGWLRTVTLNKWRENLRRRNLPGTGSSDASLSDVASPADDPFWETEYQQHLVARALELMQAEFQPTTWKACWEFVVTGKSAAEVASELGISVDTVYAAKSRVLRRLREELDGLLE